MPKLSKLQKAVDKLGALKAQIADLSAQEAEIKKALVASGEAAVEGTLFRVAISSFDRETLDSATVKGFLSPSQIAAATKTTKVVAVKVSARKAAPALSLVA